VDVHGSSAFAEQGIVDGEGGVQVKVKALEVGEEGDDAGADRVRRALTLVDELHNGNEDGEELQDKLV